MPVGDVCSFTTADMNLKLALLLMKAHKMEVHQLEATLEDEWIDEGHDGYEVYRYALEKQRKEQLQMLVRQMGAQGGGAINSCRQCMQDQRSRHCFTP
jgi:hypothetical protein